ncbi:MAG: PTS glucose transporter subunit IIA [Actinomycetaceae bacterium]|nr:PTS glucose transporter subunit IIA [Actinomycetaceae bacterium]
MSIAVTSPINGLIADLSTVSDPVFAQGMMGPGIAIVPNMSDCASTFQDVYSPVAGTVMKVLPHAFIVQAQTGILILVHLGIDTFRQSVQAFTNSLTQGDKISSDKPVLQWAPQKLLDVGMDATVIVAALECPPQKISYRLFPGDQTHQGDELFHVCIS